jgi:hypothetical protein
MIESLSFGRIIIDGETYVSDLKIFPDTSVVDQWRRAKGHRLTLDDMGDLILSKPDVIVVGTGMYGLMIPDKEIEKILTQKNIKFMPAHNKEAMKIYNKMNPQMKVGACFHLTC